MRFLFFLLFSVAFLPLSYGQSYFLVEQQAVVDSNVDSCKILSYWIKGSSDTSEPYVDRVLSFDTDGVINKETTLHSEYFVNHDSVVPIMQTIYWGYNENGLVEHKNQTISCEKMPEFNIADQIKEQYSYDFNGNLKAISYFDWGHIEMVYLYEYNQKNKITEEQHIYPNEFFSKSDFSQSKKVAYSYRDGSQTAKTYDRTGTLLDSVILQIDSSSFTKVYTEYNYRKDRRLPQNPHVYKYVYNVKWQLISKTHYLAEEVISRTENYYNENGLILKSVTYDGDMQLFYEYKYPQLARASRSSQQQKSGKR